MLVIEVSIIKTNIYDCFSWIYGVKWSFTDYINSYNILDCDITWVPDCGESPWCVS